MSQLDVLDAKHALAARLRMWGLEGDVHKLADGFIDDLVNRGWQMAPNREHRIHPPKAGEECPKHIGQHAPPWCGLCRVEDYGKRSDPEPSPDLPSVADVNPRLAERLSGLTITEPEEAP